MNKLAFLFFIIFLFSCKDGNKSNQYHFTLFEVTDSGYGYSMKAKVKTDTIYAENDSIAFVQAYSAYTRSIVAELMMKKKFAEFGRKPLTEREYSFYLFTPDSLRDISSGSFLNDPDKVKNDIVDKHFALLEKM